MAMIRRTAVYNIPFMGLRVCVYLEDLFRQHRSNIRIFKEKNAAESVIFAKEREFPLFDLILLSIGCNDTVVMEAEGEDAEIVAEAFVAFLEGGEDSWERATRHKSGRNMLEEEADEDMTGGGNRHIPENG